MWRTRSKILHDFAHHIRNPLSIIKINNEIALLHPNLPLDIKTTLQSNIDELDRASKIVNDLLK